MATSYTWSKCPQSARALRELKLLIRAARNGSAVSALVTAQRRDRADSCSIVVPPAPPDLFAGLVNRALVRALVYLFVGVRSREIVGFCIEWCGSAGDEHRLTGGVLHTGPAAALGAQEPRIRAAKTRHALPCKRT